LIQRKSDQKKSNPLSSIIPKDLLKTKKQNKNFQLHLATLLNNNNKKVLIAKRILYDPFFSFKKILSNNRWKLILIFHLEKF
jgi:hypothetical protein